jgi:hypothetical protein
MPAAFHGTLKEYLRGDFRRESVDKEIMILVHGRSKSPTFDVYFIRAAANLFKA